MYQEDYLLRQIKGFVDGLAHIVDEDEAVEEAHINDLLRGALGISIDLLDSLPATALAPLVRRGDAHDQARLEALAVTLDRLADRGGPHAISREAKASELRSLLA